MAKPIQANGAEIRQAYHLIVGVVMPDTMPYSEAAGFLGKNHYKAFVLALESIRNGATFTVK